MPTIPKPDGLPRPADSSPPWASTACMLLALASLALNEYANAQSSAARRTSLFNDLAPIVLSAAAILFSRFWTLRLERGRAGVWLLRTLIYGAAAIYTLMGSERIQSFYYLNFIARLSGLIFVLESALQHWQRPPPGQPRGAVLVFLAAIVFVLSSRTYISSFIKFLTPPFIVMLVLSMRASRTRVENSGLHPWIAAIFLAILLGGLGSVTVAAHSSELSRILMSIVKPSTYSDFSDVNARPALGKPFNQPLSQKRMLKIEGSMAERHMRGMAFDSYSTSGAWSPAMEARIPEDGTLALKARPGGERLTITPLIDSMPILYVPLHMDGINARPNRLMWARDWGGPIYSGNPAGPEPYEIAIVNETHKGPLCGIMDAHIRERCLQLPKDLDPRVDLLAKEIAKKAATPAEKLEAVRRYLYANHDYSLSVSPGQGDPVVNFLTQKKAGHCQYFASSSVLLLRCLGVPCRYVSGYYAHESPEHDVTIVRQRDAHAWTEVWLDDAGWTTFDATPSGGMPGQAGGVSRWARLWEKLGDFAESAGAWLRDAPMRKIPLLIAVIAACVLLIRWTRAWIAAFRRSRPKIKYASPGRPFEELARGFDQYLTLHGAPCPQHKPWLDHLADAKRDQAKPATIDWPQAEAFVRDYSAARFGRTDDSSIHVLRDRLKKLTS